MKTKTMGGIGGKTYVFALTLLFLSVFFTDLKIAKADTPFEVCMFSCFEDTDECAATCAPKILEDTRKKGDNNYLDCTLNEECELRLGEDYTCASGHMCQLDAILDGTECDEDSDCENLYPGENRTCEGLFTETCELPAGVEEGDGGGGSDNGGGAGAGAGASTRPTLGCDVGFESVGGVCFPEDTGLSEASISQILANLFSWLMGLFITLAVIAFIVSGLQYFMAAGDESMAESAKTNAKNALIGIIVGLSGFIVVKAVAAALSGQTYFF